MPKEVKDLQYPIPLQKGVIYGPMSSKRLGKSLGINLLPTEFKVCNFDCLYCFYGRTDYKHSSEHCPPMEGILKEVEAALRSDTYIDYITFSGNGTATLHPEFPAIVREVTALRDKHRLGIPVAILSNSTGLEKPEVLEVFSLFDMPIMKLDAATDTVFKNLNRPRQGIKVSGIIEKLEGMRGITIQTLFVDGEVVNYKGFELERWMEALIRIKPESVQIYTMDRDLVQMGLTRLTDDMLHRIADYTFKTTGVPVKAFLEPK